CRMREQQLYGRESAWITPVVSRAAAKEGDLHAERLFALGLQPAGEIPPFGPEVGVRAVVTREHQRTAGLHRRPGIVSVRSSTGERSRANRQGKRRNMQQRATLFR